MSRTAMVVVAALLCIILVSWTMISLVSQVWISEISGISLMNTDASDTSDESQGEEARRMLRKSSEHRTRSSKDASAKRKKMQKIVNQQQKYKLPVNVYRHPLSASHNEDNHAIFAFAMMQEFDGESATNFLGTARKSGFLGDIVLAVYPVMNDTFLAKAKEYGAIMYVVPISCPELGSASCVFEGAGGELADLRASINMLRYYVFQQWSFQYSPDSIILLSDFSDVFFQSDPIAYQQTEWLPHAQLVVFQEAHPNMVIKRCPWNGAWIRHCYGKSALERVGSNTVSCSGNTMGTRDAIIVYTYLMTKQMNPVVRLGSRTGAVVTKAGSQAEAGAGGGATDKCITVGMDQGFHNWLLYSGILSNYLDVKIYQQGEGSVNTVGGFYGQKKLLQLSLSQWRVVSGEAPSKVVRNWNGDPSPLIHQMDRFLQNEELEGGYAKHLAAFQDLT